MGSGFRRAQPEPDAFQIGQSFYRDLLAGLQWSLRDNFVRAAGDDADSQRLHASRIFYENIVTSVIAHQCSGR